MQRLRTEAADRTDITREDYLDCRFGVCLSLRLDIAVSADSTEFPSYLLIFYSGECSITVVQ
jgi:hypothetical protein